MKKNLLPLALAGLTVTMCLNPMEAKKISPQDALSRINVSTDAPKKIRGAASAMSLSRTVTAPESSEEAVYLFSNSRGGYVVAPADDEFPAVLGYSDSGSLDKDNLPPAFTWWMEEYARQIEAARSATGVRTREDMAGVEKHVIEPLVKSQWNQSAPYNQFCPTTTATGSDLSVTGCVATALAQVMYYYKWPAVGTGTATYTYKRGGDSSNNTLTMDFSKVPFDWDNMLDTYVTGEYTTEQGEAVANLMSACGIAVNATYGSSTGANTVNDVKALCEYFDYSKDMRYYWRDYVKTSAEWEDLIYESLAEKCPVIYSGHSDAGGHSFVCDGYAGDGYYHFNWGWAGKSDGYFLLYVLNPSDQGIGGSGAGYNDTQFIICGIHPNKEGDTSEYQAPVMYYTGDFTFGTYEKNGSTATNVFHANNHGTCGGFYNKSPYNAQVNIGLLVYDKDGKATPFFIAGDKNYATNYGTSWFRVTPSGLDEGTYSVYPGYRVVGHEELLKMNCVNGFRDHLILNVDAEGKLTYSEPDLDPSIYPEMLATSFQYRGKIYQGESTSVSMSFVNLSSIKDYYGDINLIVENAEGEELSKATFDLSIPVKSSNNLTAAINFGVEPGNYNVRFESPAGNRFIGSFPIVVSKGSSQVINEDFQFISMSPLLFEPGVAFPKITLTLKNVGTTTIAKPKLYRYFYLPDGTFVQGWSSSWSGSYAAGATAKLGITTCKFTKYTDEGYGEGLPPGEYYVKYWWDKITTDEEGNSVTTKVQISPAIYFTVGYSVESVTFDKKKADLQTGDHLYLNCTVLPEIARETNELTWFNTNPEVATIEPDGHITAIGQGSTKILAYAPNGKFDVCDVNVSIWTSIADILSGEVSVQNVFNIDGTLVLANPSVDDIRGLAKGLYVLQTSNGNIKYVK